MLGSVCGFPAGGIVDSQERRVDNSYWHLLRSGSGTGTGSLRAQGLEVGKPESGQVGKAERRELEQTSVEAGSSIVCPG